MKKKTLLIVIAILCALLLTACGCKHEWADATCTAPKTCNLCGETEGEVLPHTEGEKQLKDLTDVVEGKALYEVCCTGCGLVLSEEEVELEQLHADGKFILSVEDFEKRVKHALDVYGLPIRADLCLNESEDGTSTTVSCDFTNRTNGSMVAYIFFYDGEDILLDEDSETRMRYDDVWMVMGSEDMEASAGCMLATIYALNTTDDEDALFDDVMDIAANLHTTYAGVDYEMGVLSETELYMEAIVAD